jgi:hypothetical protein
MPKRNDDGDANKQSALPATGAIAGLNATADSFYASQVKKKKKKHHCHHQIQTASLSS